MRALLATLVILVVGCGGGPFKAPLTLGGRRYEAAQLNRGFHLYRQGCRACHGDLGDGHGASAQGLWPPPRDLRQGLYKFGRVPAPGLPPDPELARIIRGGLTGTAMLPWTLVDEDMDALLGYVKSYSPRWATEVAAARVPLSDDPTTTLPLAAVLEKGEAVYHGKAMCSTCHPAYVTRARLYELTKAMSGTGVTAYSPEMYTSRVKVTEYCWRGKTNADGTTDCTEPVRAVPPDFTHDPLRAVRADQPVSDLYLTLAGGIAGAGMPPWQGALPEDELWALARYVQHLSTLRGTTEADALWETLRGAENTGWQPPAP